MANLFCKQAKKYAATRPSYPPELFRYIASKTPKHDLAWDVGTGSGQAAVSLAKVYKNVVATDTSQEQLSYAPKLPNITYIHTPNPTHPLSALHVAQPSTVDLITVAQALHWFHLPTFYAQAKSLLKRHVGVIAVWCYTLPKVDPAVDSVFRMVYTCAEPYWAAERRTVEEEYRAVEFPFEAVEGEEGTGPVEFAAEKEMELEEYLTYVRSWSAYQTARDKGVELLTERTVDDFLMAWGGDGRDVKVAKFPIFLRIGRVGD